MSAQSKGSQYRTGKLVSLLLAVVLLSLVNGCQTTAAQKRILAFSEATNTAITNVGDSFHAVEQSYFETQLSGMIADYDPEEGFNVKALKPFLGPEHLKARTTALSAVSAYAKSLGEIMSDEQLDEFDEDTKELGAALEKFNEDNATKALSGIKLSVEKRDIDIFVTAVNAIGHWFINYKREKEVKKIVEDMHPAVGSICKLLADDIGPPEGPGLRKQLTNQYEKMMVDRDTFIRRQAKGGHLAGLELREELTALAKLPSQKTKADAALESTARSLMKIEETHGKLVKAFDKEAPDLESLIRQLAAEAKRAKSFYDDLD